jgi:hypothetical protein
MKLTVDFVKPAVWRTVLGESVCQVHTVAQAGIAGGTLASVLIVVELRKFVLYVTADRFIGLG